MSTAVLEREPLIWINGTVAEKIPAPEQGKPCKIALADGQVLYVFAEKYTQIQKGQPYSFGCASNEFKGVLRNTIRVIKAGASQPEAFRAPQAHSPAIRPAPQQQQRTAPVNQHVDPPQHTNGEFNRQTHPADARRMWICAQISAMIKSHQLIVVADPVRVTEAIDMLATAYDQSVLGNN